MTAVFRAFLISCRSVEKPGVIVLTFQVSNFRVEIFFALFLGAQFTIRFSVFVLSPTHLVGLANRGGTAPYWLGAAQLEAGRSCPMEHDGSCHRQKQPLASSSAPIEQ